MLIFGIALGSLMAIEITGQPVSFVQDQAEVVLDNLNYNDDSMTEAYFDVATIPEDEN